VHILALALCAAHVHTRWEYIKKIHVALKKKRVAVFLQISGVCQAVLPALQDAVIHRLPDATER
jgi:hypothetical protein